MDMSTPSRRKSRSYNVTSHFVIRNITLYIMIGFIFIFVMTSLSSIIQSKMNVSSSVLKKWTNHISLETLVSAISMEVPGLDRYNQELGIENPNVSNVLLEMVTSFNPKDPRSLIRSELPGFVFFDGQIVVAGQGANYTDIPIESAPPMEAVLAEREATLEEPVKDSKPKENKEDKQPQLSTEGRKVVLIYHSHNRESFLPHLKGVTSPNEANHSKVNITLIGKRLGEELEKRGIGTHVDTTDISKKLNQTKKPYSFSYAQSRQVVKEVMAKQKDVTFMFDLHRDANRREKTTLEIDGKTYAKTFFVIGQHNKNYEKNQKFAKKFHELLEKKYPGLSRGVFLKGGGNGEYNQSLSENNILIEIGGVDNTIEECYRTAEALADIIADLYWDAEKVNTQANTDSKS